MSSRPFQLRPDEIGARAFDFGGERAIEVGQQTYRVAAVERIVHRIDRTDAKRGVIVGTGKAPWTDRVIARADRRAGHVRNRSHAHQQHMRRARCAAEEERVGRAFASVENLHSVPDLFQYQISLYSTLAVMSGSLRDSVCKESHVAPA